MMDFYGGNHDNRRVPRSERVSHDIRNLWDRQHEILNRKLLGQSNVSIARELGVTPTTVSLTTNSTLGQARLRDMRFERNSAFTDAAKIIHERLLPKALGVYEEILDSDEIPTSIRKDTAKDVIASFAGMAAPQRIESLSVQITSNELEEFKRRGREAARSLGIVVEHNAQPEGGSSVVEEESL